MANDYAASVSAVAIRVTRLDSSGELMTGTNSSYVIKDFISLSMTPEYEDGDEFTQKNAAGEVCVTFKAPDTLKRVTLDIAFCNPNPEVAELLSGGVLLGTAESPLGWAAPEIGKDALPNGVAVEVWSRAIVAGKPANNNPYWHWIFPYAVLRQGGDRVLENGILGTSFEGWAVGNTGFGDGPAAPLWAFPNNTDRAYAYARTSAIPAGTGFQPVTPDA